MYHSKMKTSTGDISATSSRTQQAILRTAVRVLGQDPSASLGTIAQEADVGRTTLHRHFPDRISLLSALNYWVREQLNEATQRARLDEGSGLEVLIRLCSEYYESSDLLAYMFNSTGFHEDPCVVEESEEDQLVNATIERGQRDGSIDPLLPTSWVVQTLWAVLYTAWQYQASESITRHEVLELMTRSMRKLASR